MILKYGMRSLAWISTLSLLLSGGPVVAEWVNDEPGGISWSITSEEDTPESALANMLFLLENCGYGLKAPRETNWDSWLSNYSQVQHLWEKVKRLSREEHFRLAVKYDTASYCRLCFSAACGIDTDTWILKDDRGYESMLNLIPLARQALTSADTPPAAKKALRQVLEMLEADKQPNWPEQVLAKRVEVDWLRVVRFFQELCDAATMPDEAAALSRLQALRADMQSVEQMLPADGDSLKELADEFCGERRNAYAHLPRRYANPMLPDPLRSAGRLEALAPYFEAMPSLRELMLTPWSWESDWSSSPFSPREEEINTGAGNVCAAYELHTAGNECRLSQYGVPVSEDAVRDEIASLCRSAADTNIRFILDNPADTGVPAVQQWMRFCEQSGVQQVLLAVRRTSMEGYEGCCNPPPLTDVVRRIFHPSGKGWVQYSFCPDAPPGQWNNCVSCSDVRILTPGGRCLEYRPRNEELAPWWVPPWSPDGCYLLLPALPHKGMILVPAERLETPDFDWSSAQYIGVSEPGARYHFRAWLDAVTLRFFVSLPGERRRCDYNVATGELRQFSPAIYAQDMK